MTTMLTIKILFTINSLEKRKEKNYSLKILFTIPVDLKSTQLSLERVNLTKKNLFELKNISFQLKKKKNNHQKSRPKIMNTGVD